MNTELYSIWDSEELTPNPWRAQLHGFVGQFPTRHAAERFVAAVKLERGKPKTMQAAYSKPGKK